MLPIDPTRLDLAREFRQRPLGPHSPDLQRLLKIFRWDSITDRHMVVQRIRGGPWSIARATGPKGHPLEFFDEGRYATSTDAWSNIFRRRWKHHTGQRFGCLRTMMPKRTMPSRTMPLEQQEAFSAGRRPGGDARDDPHLMAAWDFSQEIPSTRIVDRSRHGLHGEAIILPTRAMKGWNWDGTEYNWQHRPEHYGAIHFHDDDLYDCRWETDFVYDVPDALPSGLYGARLSLDQGDAADDDWIPFVVSPPYGCSMYDRHYDGSGVCVSSRLRPVLTIRPRERLWQLPADTHIIDWLDACDIAYDVICEDDLDQHGLALLAPYRCVMTGTHPEYPSKRMIDAFARRTTITCATSAPTRSSTTTPRTSPRWSRAWTPCSIPSAAMKWSIAPSPFCARAVVPRSLPRDNSASPGTRRRRVFAAQVGRDRAHLERIAELVTSGAVRVPEIKVYPLSEAAAAHKVSESRHLRGKLVFKVR